MCLINWINDIVFKTLLNSKSGQDIILKLSFPEYHPENRRESTKKEASEMVNDVISEEKKLY